MRQKEHRIRQLECELSLAYEEIGLLADLLADAECEKEMQAAWAEDLQREWKDAQP